MNAQQQKYTNMKTLKELLKSLDACQGAREWAGDMTIEEVVKKCHRGDWLIWLAQKIGIELRPLTLAMALCAKTVLHLMKDKRSINAVEVAERFGRGEVTKEELNAAYAAAAAYTPPYADDAYAYADDAYAYAAYAAYPPYADDAYAAAAYAADAAYDVAYVAAYPDTREDDAAAACKANQLQTANICREIIGDIIIQIVNAKLSC